MQRLCTKAESARLVALMVSKRYGTPIRHMAKKLSEKKMRAAMLGYFEIYDEHIRKMKFDVETIKEGQTMVTQVRGVVGGSVALALRPNILAKAKILLCSLQSRPD